jgi:hypothetical protein
MSYNTLTLNSSNVIGNTNSSYLLKFTTGNYTINQGAKICVSSVTMPYSWYNITANYNNNTFQFQDWLQNIYTITLPDGFYALSDIMNYIEFFCIQNGLYLINSAGQNVFYVNLLLNQNYYAIQLLTYVVPTSLPSGWSQPSNFVGFPPTSTAAALTILDNGFQSILGYSAGTYGGGSTDQSFLSNILVNASPVNSLIIQCSLVNNPIINPPNVLTAMPISNTIFGANITFNPYFEKWVNISSGTYNSLTISFVDQNYNTVNMLDSNVCINLIIQN